MNSVSNACQSTVFCLFSPSSSLCVHMCIHTGDNGEAASGDEESNFLGKKTGAVTVYYSVSKAKLEV